jgi:molybdenum cofactor guanylyltransferase
LKQVYHAAFILAGGKSSRMGSDKGLMPFRGKPMVLIVAEVLSGSFESIRIISNSDAYTKFGLEVIPDDIPGIGPIGGIVTGLKKSATEWSFFAACDMPLITTDLIKNLTDQIDNQNTSACDAILFLNGNRIEPVFGLYHRRALVKFEEMIAGNNLRLQDIRDRMNVCLVDLPVSLAGSLKSMNSRHELDEYG